MSKKGFADILKQLWLPLVLMLAGICLLAASAVAKRMTSDPETVAAKVSRRIEKSVATLDAFAARMAAASPEEWTVLNRFPDDMVLYRYVCDTLQCWANEFPVVNDDIRSKMRYQWLSRPEFEVSSPLNGISDDLCFVNLGPKWYLAKWIGRGELTEIIAAIEVCSSSLEGKVEDINPRLPIPRDYTIYPIAGNSGTPVCYREKTLFSINQESSVSRQSLSDSLFRWLALLAFVLSALALLRSRRGWLEFSLALAVLACAYCHSFQWGSAEGNGDFFSPAVYAGPGLWSSFGSLLCLSALIFCVVLCIFMMRRRLVDGCAGRLGRRILLAIPICLAIAGIMLYTAFSLRDLMSNSNISIVLRWFGSGIGYSLLALIMYSSMMMSMMMLCNMLPPLIRPSEGHSRRFLSLGSISASTLLFTAFLFGISTAMGFDREIRRVGVWANRLSVDRNLTLELQLRSVEEAIAVDQFIPTFADMEEAASIIGREIAERYFINVTTDYYVEVSVCNHDDRECNALFNSRIAGGTPIAPGSRFVCNFDYNGRSSYAGTFMYISKEGRLVRMLVELISRASKEDNGYYSIFDKLGKPGEVVMPDRYSYGKYIDGSLASYRGSFAYPIVLAGAFREDMEAGRDYFKKDGYIHFYKKVADNEIFFISRRSRNSMAIATAFLSIYAIVFLMLTPLLRYGRTGKKAERRSFKNRIRGTLTLTVSLALAALAFVSVKFVFDRNSIDSSNVMSEKISAIQTIIESRCQGVESLAQVDKTEWMSLLQDVASNTKSDLSLYTPKGNIYLSTVAEMYELALLSCRINGEAYNTIVHNHQRLCIHKEEAAGKKYYALYAPILGSRSQTLAIVCTPFSRDDLMKDVMPHAILLIILLVAIIFISSTVATQIIDKIFAPLSKVSSKMEAAGTSGLEYIEYKGKDEISTLVDAYNRMVADLEESNRILAQNERDKAWSAMARQVAHEIKNPLTPISLELQKLQYLKQKNDPRWVEKFDNSARIIEDHINILKDTANEFSTFAKLYTEPPVGMDLDQTLHDQVTLFNNREDIEITYLGFKFADFYGPRPQLIRVFVNLLTNATQAIENERRDYIEAGKEPKPGRIRVELRQDSECYEISIEDNGPGVSEENREKLFTPNFTTKTGGTGLGLAICRNIVEKCGGTITYKKSFTLEGACFTVRLPKP